MLEYQNTTHLTRIDKNENVDGYLTHDATKYNIAIGLYSAKSWNPEVVDYQGYLEIEFSKFSWGLSEDLIDDQNPFNLRFDSIDTHSCTFERDLYPHFNEIPPESEDSIMEIFESMTCVSDLSRLNLMGTAGTTKGDSLQVTFTRCKNETEPAEPHCKSNPEIDEFIKEHRMIIFYNDQNYLSETYGSGSVNYEVKVGWINFDIHNPFYRTYYLQEQAVESEEIFFNPGWFSPEESQLFTVTQ